jgi:hypothetical protein
MLRVGLYKDQCAQNPPNFSVVTCLYINERNVECR